MKAADGDPAELLRRARAATSGSSTGGSSTGLVAALVGGSSRSRVAAAESLATALGRELFRLDLERLVGPQGIAAATGQLLDAATTAGAITLLDGAELLLPAPGSGPACCASDRWALDVCALAVREQLGRHTGVTLLDVGSNGQLHPVVADGLELTVRLPVAPRGRSRS